MATTKKKPASKPKYADKKQSEKLTAIETELKKGIQYVRKHNRFRSGVRRFGVCVMTEETYPNFKFIRYKNEEERDDEFLNMLTQPKTKEYPQVDKE